MTDKIERLREFVATISRLVEQAGPAGANEAVLLACATGPLRELVAHDDWLPEAMAQPHPIHYQQYLLYGDPLDRFSLLSFVWGPGQQTPVHDHTVWGLIGVLRGAEIDQRYRVEAGQLLPDGDEVLLRAGQVAAVSPTLGDVHRVRNAHDDQVSISIHLYGGNIGRIQRHVYDAASAETRPFVSGYANELVPNLWPPAAA
jgi:predicted metal-dependent enzyme (double-stranded beta helix superfamily)